jgi:dipeptidyl aminopeptidase/acylaminoacyl peptidase
MSLNSPGFGPCDEEWSGHVSGLLQCLGFHRVWCCLRSVVSVFKGDSKLIQTVLRGWLAACCLLVSTVVWAAPPPASLFFGPGDVQETALSPSGRYLAMTTARPGARVGLFVFDLVSDKPPVQTAQFRDADVVNVQWVSDERLLFSAIDYSEGGGRPDGAPGLFAINPDGKEMRQLIKRQQFLLTDGSSSDRSLDWNHVLLRVLTPKAGEPATEVIVGAHSETTVTPMWLNVYTGRTRSMSLNSPAGGYQWLFDGRGEPRVVVSRTDTRRQVHWRGPGQQAWQLLTEGDLISLPFEPHTVDDAGNLYVTQRSGARGELVLSPFDFATGKPGEPLVSSPGFDFDGRLVLERGSGRAQGLRLTTDADTSVWFDPAYKKLQALADAHLPGQVNSIYCRRCGADDAVMLVRSHSDQNPGTLWIYRAAPGEGKPNWQRAASVRQGVDPRQMASVVFERIKARDGLDLPVWITLPAGFKKGEPRPAVVLVHGGPWVRGGVWAWQPMQQFLASRGYVVIEPEFRGSTGYGEAHFKAGFKQWGQAMQDDVADALLWAQQQGLASSKACIAGASYGGYSTLMGLVRHPELYRCGVAWVAVTDLELLLKGSWFVRDDTNGLTRKHTLPQMIGDIDKDAVMLRDNSPVLQAARIKAPLLLAMGELDVRVPLAHGRRMKQALEAAGNPPEWVVYPGEAHGWVLPKNQVDFAERMERFLAKQLR